MSVYEKTSRGTSFAGFFILKDNVPLCCHSKNSQNGFSNPVGHPVRENGWTLVPT